MDYQMTMGCYLVFGFMSLPTLILALWTVIVYWLDWSQSKDASMTAPKEDAGAGVTMESLTSPMSSSVLSFAFFPTLISAFLTRIMPFTHRAERNPSKDASTILPQEDTEAEKTQAFLQEFRDLKLDLQVAKDKEDEMKEMLSKNTKDNQAECKRLTDEVKVFKTLNANLQQKLDHSERSLLHKAELLTQRYKQAAQDRTDQLLVTQDELEDVQRQFQDYMRHSATQSTSLPSRSSSDMQNLQLLGDNQTLRESLRKLEATNSTFTQSKLALQQELNMARTDATGFRNQFEESQTALAKEISEREALAENFNEQFQIAQEVLSKTTVEKDASVTTLNLQLKATQLALSRVNLEKDDSTKSLSQQLQATQAALSRAIQEKEASMINLNQQLQVSQAALSRVTLEKENSVTALKAQLETTKAELSQAILDKETMASTALTEGTIHPASTTGKLQMDVQEAQAAAGESRLQLESVEVKFEELKTHFKAMEGERNELNAKLGQWHEEGQSAALEYNNLRSNYEQLSNNLETQTTLNTILQEQLISAKSANDNRNAEMRSLSSSNVSIRMESRALQVDNKTYKTQIEDLQRQLAMSKGVHEGKDKELNRMNRAFVQLRIKCDKQAAELKFLKEDFDMDAVLAELEACDSSANAVKTDKPQEVATQAQDTSPVPTCNPPVPIYNPPVSVFNPPASTYNPLAPVYDPLAPVYDPMASVNDPMASIYDPLAPIYNPLAPASNPSAPAYNPLAPVSNPSAPAYNPLAPVYDPMASVNDPVAAIYDPLAPFYNPLKPGVVSYAPPPQTISYTPPLGPTPHPPAPGPSSHDTSRSITDPRTYGAAPIWDRPDELDAEESDEDEDVEKAWANMEKAKEVGPASPRKKLKPRLKR